MKKMILTAVFAAATLGATQANAFNQNDDVRIETRLQDKQEIKFAEVPAAVKDAFRAEGHAEEHVLKIFKIDLDENLTEYKFLLEEDGEKTEISYKAKTKA
ncbi:MAG: hypothetical protein L0J45_00735 [Psychroflexus sp.]|nr:hypothetical protein [Psychroflexus sp.]MDN6310317.1 hypothetical protein [Psychroflexus sp.]